MRFMTLPLKVGLSVALLFSAACRERPGLQPAAGALCPASSILDKEGLPSADTSATWDDALPAPGLPARGPVPSLRHRLEVPSAPVLLTGEAARLYYVLDHYWHNFDFADTAWVSDTAAFMRVFADWVGLLAMVPPREAARFSYALIRKTEISGVLQKHFFSVSEMYFDNPNSPYRNETLFLGVLRAYLESPLLSKTDKLRPRMQLDRALKNRPGTLSADLELNLPQGGRFRLHDVKAEHLLLLFYNPGCEDCARVESVLSSSLVLRGLEKDGRLKVVAVYPDEDLALWESHLPQMPRGWIVACDSLQQINAGEAYFLPAIPNLYLLDARKQVVLKDAPVEEILAYLESLP